MNGGALRTARKVYCDANVLIYLIEKNSDYHALVYGLLHDLKALGASFISSKLVIAETLTGAVRRNNPDITAAYEAFFGAASDPMQLGSRLAQNFDLHLIPVSDPILWAVPDVARDFRLDLPDAIHFATALDQGCDAFLTNDKGFTDGEPFPTVYRLSDL